MINEFIQSVRRLLQGGAGHSQGQIVNDYLNQELDLAAQHSSVTPINANYNVLYTSEETRVFKPCVVRISLVNMVGTDQVTIRVRHRIAPGIAWELKDSMVYDNGQTNTIIEISLLEEIYGVEVALAQTAVGTGYKAYRYHWIDAKAGG